MLKLEEFNSFEEERSEESEERINEKIESGEYEAEDGLFMLGYNEE